MIVIVVTDLVKSFSPDFTAVKGISFAVKKGEIVGLLGPNGAGKTTTIHMLLGILTPTSGTIQLCGKDAQKYRSEVLQHITFASAYIRFPGRLTVLENLDIIGRLYSLSALERSKGIQAVLEHFGMWEYRNRYAYELSAGQITRVMLAKAFLPCPDLVILDEPTASLDPDIALEVRHFILERRKQYGTTVLITSHNMAEVSELCDRVLVMKHGQIIADATPYELARSVSTVRIHFILPLQERNKASALADRHGWLYEIDDYCMIVHIDEKNIAQVFIEYARAEIIYDQVSIEKPTLEDYFLKVVHS